MQVTLCGTSIANEPAEITDCDFQTVTNSRGAAHGLACWRDQYGSDTPAWATNLQALARIVRSRSKLGERLAHEREVRRLAKTKVLSLSLV
ncbi:MAG: hypothetical protein VR74_10330, partial [Hyphomonas sp. BRH_c22]